MLVRNDEVVWASHDVFRSQYFISKFLLPSSFVSRGGSGGGDVGFDPLFPPLSSPPRQTLTAADKGAYYNRSRNVVHTGRFVYFLTHKKQDIVRYDLDQVLHDIDLERDTPFTTFGTGDFQEFCTDSTHSLLVAVKKDGQLSSFSIPTPADSDADSDGGAGGGANIRVPSCQTISLANTADLHFTSVAHFGDTYFLAAGFHSSSGAVHLYLADTSLGKQVDTLAVAEQGTLISPAQKLSCTR